MTIPVQCERSKKIVVDGKFIHGLRQSCNWRKAERLPGNSFFELYVGSNALNTIESPEHQIIWGRRGTGKTHLLKAFVQKVNSDPNRKEMAFYISCDEACMHSPLDIQFPSDEDKMKYYARDAFKSFLSSLTEQIIDLYAGVLDLKYFFKEEYDELERENKLVSIDARLEDLLANCDCGIPVISQRERINTNVNKAETSRESSFDAGGEISKTNANKSLIFSLMAKLQHKKNRSVITTASEGDEIKYTYSFSLKRTRECLIKIINALGIDMLYICIDEFWLIDKKRDICLQPMFWDYLRQVFLNLPKISIKVASIREVTKLNSKASAANSFGVQSGHDIHEALNLDTLFVTDEDKLRHYKDILYSRINYFSNEGCLVQDDYSIDYIINALFKTDVNLSALIAYTHAIPRNFLTALQKSLYAIDFDLQRCFIHRYLIRQIVIDIYLNERRSNIPMNEGSLFSVINDYINSTKHYFFLLSTADKKRFKTEIDNLIYIEAIHQVPSSILPANIMDRYKGFYIDSGKFLHTIGYIESGDDEGVPYNFSYVLPSTVLTDYDRFVLNLNAVESEFLECPNCSARVNKNNPVYLKASLCPTCAFEFETTK